MLGPDDIAQRKTFEHLIVPIPEFQFNYSGTQSPSWDSYPCGSFLPFFGKFNSVPYHLSRPVNVLYLPRGPRVVNHRIMRNEHDVTHALMMMEGQNVVLFEHTTIEEDAKRFNEADVIIGLHGGAFGNLVFCRKDTIVIEMNVPEEQGRQCFGYMAHNLGLEYYRYGLNRSAYYTSSNDFYDSNNIRVNVDEFVQYYRPILMSVLSRIPTNSTPPITQNVTHPTLPAFTHFRGGASQFISPPFLVKRREVSPSLRDERRKLRFELPPTL